MDLDPRIFGLKRAINGEQVICLTNISNSDVAVDFKLDGFKNITKEKFNGKLTPYQVVWLKK
jgi:predicted pyridoxine 5'-phosphate oxidase superfamily flavin-nucleotide-binding protein